MFLKFATAKGNTFGPSFLLLQAQAYSQLAHWVIRLGKHLHADLEVVEPASYLHDLSAVPDFTYSCRGKRRPGDGLTSKKRLAASEHRSSRRHNSLTLRSFNDGHWPNRSSVRFERGCKGSDHTACLLALDEEMAWAKSNPTALAEFLEHESWWDRNRGRLKSSIWL